jgi:hypothetical protein
LNFFLVDSEHQQRQLSESAAKLQEKAAIYDKLQRAAKSGEYEQHSCELPFLCFLFT